MKILIWTLIAIVALYLLLPFERNTIILDKATLDASEAFFRYEFAKKKESDVDAFFRKIKEKDPPRQLLARFRGHSPRVQKGSDAQYDVHGVRNGYVFWIDSFTWYLSAFVVIHGGLYMGNLGLETGDYTLAKIMGNGIVVSYTPGMWA
jgi:hypothetical protein